jgi:hypothetical protein
MYVPTYSYVHVFTYTHSFLYSCVYVCMYAHTCALLNTYVTCSTCSYVTGPQVHMLFVQHVHMSLVTCSYLTCPHVHSAHLFICSQVYKLICSYVPVYQLYTYTHISLVTWPRIHLITQCSPVLLYTHVLLICSRVHLFIVPCAHMAGTHDIACSRTHTPMYTH